MKLLSNRKQNEYFIDAQQYKYGRLCSMIATHILDKTNPFRSFEKPNSIVYVRNYTNINISDKKKHDTLFRSYSGYQGGLKERRMNYFIENQIVDRMIRRTVWRMLPKSRYYRRSLMERLIFTNE